MPIASAISLLTRWLNHGYSLSLVRNYFYNIPLDILGSMAGSFLVIYVAKQSIKIPYLGQYLTWFGRYSLIVLCFHLIELNLFPWTGVLKYFGFTHLFIPMLCGKIFWATGAIFLVRKMPILSRVFGVK